MIHGMADAPDPAPRANPALAVDCDICGGWGTVITYRGSHELCPACQPHGDQSYSDSSATRAE